MLSFAVMEEKDEGFTGSKGLLEQRKVWLNLLPELSHVIPFSSAGLKGGKQPALFISVFKL